MSGPVRRLPAAASVSAGFPRPLSPARFPFTSSSSMRAICFFSPARRALLARTRSRLVRQAPSRPFSSSSASSAFFSARKHAPPAREKPPIPFATVSSCPAPTCTCEPMPKLSWNLPIDYKSPLNGLIGAYNEQVLVCTGTSDWPSRIEDGNSGDNLAADLKELFGRGGTYSDPYHNVSVLNASFPSSVPRNAALQSSSVYLLPSFTYVPFLPRLSFDAVEALAQGFLLPERLHSAHDGHLSPIHRDRLTRRPAVRSLLYGVCESIPDILVLICGHGERDARCGIWGPVLQAAFERELARVGFRVEQGPKEVDGEDGERSESAPTKTPARVGLISHIGGHKFAGNVILYLPPSLRTPDGLSAHPLAGYGVWYGRVETQHVEGLVQETVLQGRVVEEHFRGAINDRRQIIRL